jgi:S1-C subfamily serine protease
VTRAAVLAETVAMPRPTLSEETRGAAPRSIGARTLFLVRQTLGLPEGVGVEDVVRRKTRAIGIVFAALVLVMLGTMGVVYRTVREQGEAEVENLRANTDRLVSSLDGELRAARAAVEAQREAWVAQRSELESARGAWEEQRSELEDERHALEEKIRVLESGDREALTELALVRRRLDDTGRTLALYDPVNLERSKLREVSRVEAAVVLIEARQTLRELGGERMLFIDESQRTPEEAFNLEGRGAPFRQDVTGSGFCVSADGWIISNAHVVFRGPAGGDGQIDLGSGFVLAPTVELAVVFSGRGERHPAELVRWERSEREDLALLKIEPFEGMPHLGGIDLDFPVPERGTEVFLLGFPLGRQVLQQGDVMLASTFRGIVSRQVDYYLQIDAAVHPGASGGPVIDGMGHVLGVVTGMQVADGQTQSSAIGYVIPIRELSGIWPPPE